MTERGITLEALYAIRSPNAQARWMIAELEAERSRGCSCAVELHGVQVLEAHGGTILSLVHELSCPRWVALTS